MRDVVMARGRIRFQREDVIRAWLIELIPVQHDLERPQLNVLQHDRIGHDGDRVLLQVAVELTELRLQGIEFVVDLPQSQPRIRRLVRQLVDLAATAIDVSRKNSDSTFEV